MNITEMIDELSKILETHGDIPVCIDHDGASHLIENAWLFIEDGTYYKSPYDHDTWKGTEVKGKYLCL